MADQGVSLPSADNTQISAAAHAVTLALLKLNRLIPRAVLSIHGRLSRWSADRRKQSVRSRIDEAKADIAMNQELLKLSGDQPTVQLPEALATRMQKQRKESRSAGYFLFNRELRAQRGSEEVTKVELIILNRKHNILITQLTDRLAAIDRDHRQAVKAAKTPIQISCLVGGLVTWCSIVIGLILGLGEFNKQDSFVTAFTIITSVATSEYDYFTKIVFANRMQLVAPGEPAAQRLRQEDQHVTEQAQPERRDSRQENDTDLLLV